MKKHVWYSFHRLFHIAMAVVSIASIPAFFLLGDPPEEVESQGKAEVVSSDAIHNLKAGWIDDEKNGIAITWDVPKNQNVGIDTIVLERSTDGNQWDVSAYITVKDGESDPVNYRYEDSDTSGDNVIYYRLQYDDRKGRHFSNPALFVAYLEETKDVVVKIPASKEELPQPDTLAFDEPLTTTPGFSPSGTLFTVPEVYQWGAEDQLAVSAYVLTLSNSNGEIFSKTVKPEDVCVDGTCRLDQPASLVEGSYLFEVDMVIDGETFISTNHTFLLKKPDQPIVLEPADFIQTATPLYQWQDVYGATGYGIRIAENGRTIFEQSIAKDNAALTCRDGMCSFDPGVELVEGKSYEFWVRSDGPLGNGPWGSGKTYRRSSKKVGHIPGTFSVSALGNANYSVPLQVPPGTGGMQPDLALAYNHKADNGLLGRGWTLTGLSRITRSSQTVAQDGAKRGVGYSSTDRFRLDGSRLMCVSGTYGANGAEYRTEMANFKKIVSYGNQGSGPSYFKVWHKSGVIAYYGNTSDSKVQAEGKSEIRVWALNKIQDLSGNYIVFNYTKDHDTGEYRPREIRYTGNAGLNLSPYNSVRFVYEDRTAEIPRFVSGSMVKPTKRMSRIETYTGASKVKSYRLSYSHTSTYTDTLFKITECDSASNCLEPTVFVSQVDPGGFSQSKRKNALAFYIGGKVSEASNDTSRLKFGDFDGDGKTDTYLVRGSASNTPDDVFLASGGHFKGVANWQSGYGTPSYFKIDTARYKFADFNGDGKTDLYFVEGSNSTAQDSIYLSNGNGFNWPPIKGPATYVNSYNNADAAQFDIARIKFGDFNGDGRTDVYYVEGTNGNAAIDKIYLWNGNGFDSPVNGANTIAGTSAGMKAFLSFINRNSRSFDPSRIKLGDFNGDGMTDVYYALGATFMPSADEVDKLYFSNGHGLLPPVNALHTLKFSDSMREEIDVARLAVGDFNGDGLADIYYMRGSGSLKEDDVFLSKGDGKFHRIPGIKTAFSRVASLKALGIATLKFTDLNGDGKTDIYKVNLSNNGWATDEVIFSRGDGTYVRNVSGLNTYVSTHVLTAMFNLSTFRFGDFDGNGMTDLYKIDGWGNSVYDSIYYNQATHPYTTKIIDGLDVTTQIEYRPLTDSGIHGIAHSSNPAYPIRNLRAPMFVVSEHKTSDGVGGDYRFSHFYKNAKWHSQGRGFLGFGTKETYDHERVIFSTKTYLQDPNRPFANLLTSSHDWYLFNNLIKRVYKKWSFQTSYGGKVIFPYTYKDETYSYGLNNDLVNRNMILRSYDSYGNVVNAQRIDMDSSGLSNTTRVNNIHNTYSNNTSNWQLGYTTHSKSFSALQNQAAIFRRIDYQYNNKRLLTQETFQSNTTKELVKSYSYDGYGNQTSFTSSGYGVGNRTTTTSYDSKGRFPLIVTNPVGHKVTKAYEPKFGAVTSTTTPLNDDPFAPNNKITTTAYDSFGRAISIKSPDNVVTNIQYSWCGGGCPPNAKYHISESKNGNFMSLHKDQFERDLRSTTLGFDGTLVHRDTEYDSLGRVKRSSNPYFAGSSPVWTNYQYDAIDRPVSETYPNGNTVTHNYQGLLATATNGKNQATRFKRNHQGQVLEVLDADLKKISYTYDSDGKPIEIRDSENNLTKITYDVHGNRTSIDDPDLGKWFYFHNVYGELIQQIDAKNQTMLQSYDDLGRMVQRIEPEGMTEWFYDGATNGLGQIEKVKSFGGYRETYGYDSLGRTTAITRRIDNVDHTIRNTYDAQSRVSSVEYPTGLELHYLYNGFDYLRAVVEHIGTPPNLAIKHHWRAEKLDARSQILEEIAGNNLKSRYSYNTVGQLTSIKTGFNPGIPSVQDLRFGYDVLGNTTFRSDMMGSPKTEIFGYDNLNRLVDMEHYATTKGSNPSMYLAYTKTYSYNSIGNIINKSDLGNYTYGQNGAGPHAVTRITTPLEPPTPRPVYPASCLVDWYQVSDQGNLYEFSQKNFIYDANGNMTTGNCRQISYTSFNKPRFILSYLNNNTRAFTYGPSRERIKQVSTDGGQTTTTTYVGGVYEKRVANGQSKHIHYVAAGGRRVAILTQTGANTSVEYLHQDSLDSIDLITNDQAQTVEDLSFDPFGKRRKADWTDGIPADPDDLTNRGYTDHEHLDDFGLIHMNGRAYDPDLGRFISADPYVPFPESQQSYNRYSYVFNNPMSLNDPTGYNPCPPNCDPGGGGTSGGSDEPPPMTGYVLPTLTVTAYQTRYVSSDGGAVFNFDGYDPSFLEVSWEMPVNNTAVHIAPMPVLPPQPLPVHLPEPELAVPIDLSNLMTPMPQDNTAVNLPLPPSRPLQVMPSWFNPNIPRPKPQPVIRAPWWERRGLRKDSPIVQEVLYVNDLQRKAAKGDRVAAVKLNRLQHPEWWMKLSPSYYNNPWKYLDLVGGGSTAKPHKLYWPIKVPKPAYQWVPMLPALGPGPKQPLLLGPAPGRSRVIKPPYQLPSSGQVLITPPYAKWHGKKWHGRDGRFVSRQLVEASGQNWDNP